MPTTPDFQPAVFTDGSYTCICIARSAAAVKFISMSELDVETLSPKAFDALWAVKPEYPVKRAAERYLASVQYRTIPAKAYEHLSSIAASAADYATFESVNVKPKGTVIMAKKAPNGMDSIVNTAKTKPRAEAKPVAKAPAKTKPQAKAAAAPKAPAVKAPAKTKPEAVKAPKAAAAPKTPKAPDTTKYKIGDVTSVKRGFLAEFVEKAQALKQFTREAVEAACGEAVGTPEHAKMRTYFPYCVGKGIFTAAK